MSRSAAIAKVKLSVNHPCSSLPSRSRSRVFFPLLALTILMMVVMNQIALPLETDAAPYGIISFELAGDAAASRNIIASWDETARIHAAFSLGLDYLFLVVYSTTIGLACIWTVDVLESNSWRLAGIGITLAWGLWFAALLDGIENTGLIWILFGGSAQYWAFAARWCALVKFGLIFAGLTYAFLGLAVYFSSKARS